MSLTIEIHEILEILMMLTFGASWPINALKSYRSRSTRGKSLAFLVLIFSGYVFGIASKFVAVTFSPYVLAVYIFNIFWVSVDLVLYFRNLRLDRMNGL